MENTRIAREHLEWLWKHNDESKALTRYLKRLEQVVCYYESSSTDGPTWGGVRGYQWVPLRTWKGDSPDIAFLESHPNQMTKERLILDED